MAKRRTPEQERADFLERRHIVAARAVELFDRCGFGDMERKMDYLSLYTTTEAEEQRLSDTVRGLGRYICNKNGPVVQLRPTIESSPVLPALVRVRSRQNTELLGCADFVVDDYELARQRLVEAGGYTESQKLLNGHSYTIIEVVDPELEVAAYFPSRPMSELMAMAS